MRNLGIIVLLVIFGMSLWKASDRYRPVPYEPEPVVSEPDPALDPVDSSGAVPEEPVSIPAEELSPQIEKPAHQDFTEETRDVESVKRAVKPRLKTKSAVEDEKSFDQLVIPSLKLNASVVSKPYTDLSWDLTTLGQDVAHLGDIPNQTSENNIVMAGHVTVYNGSNGPFRYLWRMEPGDRIILKDDNVSYTYIVREHVLVYPDEASVLEDSRTPQLTLITCTTWDEETLSYLRRRVIVADLESVEYQQMLLD